MSILSLSLPRTGQSLKIACAVSNTHPIVPPVKPRENFETLATAKMDETAAALLEIPASDSHRIALFQGTYKGLKLALELYRQAARMDADQDVVAPPAEWAA